MKTECKSCKELFDTNYIFIKVLYKYLVLAITLLYYTTANQIFKKYSGTM